MESLENLRERCKAWEQPRNGMDVQTRPVATAAVVARHGGERPAAGAATPCAHVGAVGGAQLLCGDRRLLGQQGHHRE